MGKTFEEYWWETKSDHVSDIKDWVVSETIYGNEIDEDRLKRVIETVWYASRQNMTTRDI